MDQHLRVIRQKLRGPLEAEFASGGLTGPQRLVMEHVTRLGGVSLKELSANVSLAHSTVSGIVDRLEARGFVVRHKDKKDGRATVIEASAKVCDFLSNRMPELALGPLFKVLDAATESDRATVVRGLRKLRTLVDPEHARQSKASLLER